MEDDRIVKNIDRHRRRDADLSVICGEPALLDNIRDCALNPVAVFEVLSKSTGKYDRRPPYPVDFAVFAACPKGG